MKIIVVSRSIFNEYLTRKGITDANVEEQSKVFFISINNQHDKQPPYFSGDKSNVKVMTFADLEEDKELLVIGENKTELFKAMTREQAADLYQFIKANKDKEAVIIHCTLGVARSGAVGAFINDFTGSNWEEFKRVNPSVQPNPHVYRLLHDEWYKDIAHNDAVTGEPINESKLEVINPRSNEEMVAEYNQRHPDQHTSITVMTNEEIKEKYGVDAMNGEKAKPYLQDEIGQTEPMRGYQKGENKLVGARFIHPDGSSTYVAGVDPFYDEPEFEPFWLETDKYYGMVTQQDLKIVGHFHHLQEILPARKKTLPPGQFEAFPEFGFGPEYGGIDLRTWLTLKNMTSFFRWFGAGMVLTSKYADYSQKYGVDGQSFKLNLDKEFKHLDVLHCGDKDIVPVIVTDDPVEHIVEECADPYSSKCEYWLHTVKLFTNETNRFLPGKFLAPGTRYYKM